MKNNPSPAEPPEFVRVKLPALPQFDNRPVYVRAAIDPQTTKNKRSMEFRVVSVTEQREEAAVYPANLAAAMLAILGIQFPGADLEPANFNDWVNAPMIDHEKRS